MASKLEELGLEAYLDGTKGLHGNNGYKEFVRLNEANTPISKIAEAFGVTRPTVYEWLKLYDKIKA